MVHVAVWSAASYGLRFGVNFGQTASFGRGKGMNAASTNAYHVASLTWQPMLSQSRGIDWKEW